MAITGINYFGRIDKGSAQNDAINLDNQETPVVSFSFNNDDGSDAGDTLELDVDPVTMLPIAGSEDPNTTITIAENCWPTTSSRSSSSFSKDYRVPRQQSSSKVRYLFLLKPASLCLVRSPAFQ